MGPLTLAMSVNCLRPSRWPPWVTVTVTSQRPVEST